jgi:hypothetical protein
MGDRETRNKENEMPTRYATQTDMSAFYDQLMQHDWIVQSPGVNAELVQSQLFRFTASMWVQRYEYSVSGNQWQWVNWSAAPCTVTQEGLTGRTQDQGREFLIWATSETELSCDFTSSPESSTTMLRAMALGTAVGAVTGAMAGALASSWATGALGGLTAGAMGGAAAGLACARVVTQTHKTPVGTGSSATLAVDDGSHRGIKPGPRRTATA